MCQVNAYNLGDGVNLPMDWCMLDWLFPSLNSKGTWQLGYKHPVAMFITIVFVTPVYLFGWKFGSKLLICD